MMRNWILAVVFAVSIKGFSADSPVLTGERFDGRHVEIIWAAPTNDLPTTLRIYKVVAQEFSPEVLSTLLNLGSFVSGDKTNNLGHGEFDDKSILFYRNKEKTKSLGIYPTQGWLKYRDSTAEASAKEPPIDVPNEKEAYQMALSFLPKLGIGPDQFATQRGTKELRAFQEYTERGRYDKSLGHYTKEYPLRGVLLTRRIDGIDFYGKGTTGGLRINFGNHGKVINLELVWPNLIPYKQLSIATPGGFVEMIKKGSAVVPSPSSVDTSAIKKITITKTTFFYMGGLGDEPPKFIYPFAAIEAKADIGETNVTFQLHCPAFKK